MIKHLLCINLLFLVFHISFAQSVGIGTTAPHSSAALDVSSNSKGMLLPRFTSTQRINIGNPAKGLMVYDSTQHSYWYYTGSNWKDMSGSNLAADSNFVTGQQNPLASYNMSNSGYFAADTSGYLYDSGGPGGNYGNNETTTFNINTHSLHVATDITILSMNTESPYDSLEIKDSYNNRYVFYGNTTGKLRMFGAVYFTFRSNSFNTQAGFLIRWDKILEPLTGGSYDSTQLSGWYFNTTKMYARGGVNVTNNWSPENSGRNSFAFGSNGKAMGNNSVALGISNKVKSLGGLAIGTFGDTTDTGSPEFPVLGNRLFQIGNGTSIAARSNAMTVWQNGDIGIGTVNPLSKFHIKGGLLLDGTNGSTPVSGAGTRLMWIPAKAAFRAGAVAANQWDDASVGVNSFAAGLGTVASGTTAVALGEQAVASGNASFASGRNTTASGNYSTATGFNTTASGIYATAMGGFTQASGQNAVAMGVSTNASGDNSFSAGFFSVASGQYSTAFGRYTTASGSGGSFVAGNGSVASGSTAASIGWETKAMGDNSIAVGAKIFSKSFGGLAGGVYNDTLYSPNAFTTDPLNRVFEIGNGVDDFNRSNALTVLQNGNTGIGKLVPEAKLHIAGSGAANQLILENSGTSGIVRLSNDGGGSGAYIGTTTNHSFSVVTNNSSRVTISSSGNVGIGNTAPAVPLQFANAAGNKIAFFQSGSNYYGMGTQTSLLQVYTPTAADDIAFGYGNSGSFTENIRMDGSGSLAVKTNVTVQNGKGIIRSTDGTQKKQLSASVTINTSFLAGETKQFTVTWPEAFAAAPDAYVGNITGGTGGWAEVVMTISAAGTGGATLYIYNPKTTSVTPNFTVKVIAIGAQ